jgi:hypothetical protein
MEQAMGFSLAWFAAQGIDRDDFLERLGFTDTGEVDEYFDQDHSGGELPGGWYIILTSDLGLLAPDKLARWSTGCRLVATVVHEDSANSLATEWKDGRLIWSVSHDGSEGGDQLAVEGQLPDVFDELKHEADALQVADVVFDIPLDLAAELTGFRHDEMGFDDDIPPFTILERTHLT